MQRYEIAPGVAAALKDFKLPEKLGFGAVPAPVMFSAEWSNGSWSRGVLKPFGPIEILPGARALQYAEVVFEGLKAYAVGRSWPNLFRARDNWQRFTRSAERLSMAAVPEALFFEAIDAVAGSCNALIPRTSGRSLYLRPFIYGAEDGYLLRNSTRFCFVLIANPVEVYSTGPMRVAIERADVRAAVGGLGTAKAAANYAASLRASNAAVARGYTVALWLDAREQRWIQELSGMNLFAVIGGKVHTPELDGTILPGITRDSLITLGRHLGYTMVERPMELDELLMEIQNGECTELFACGTAAIVTPIGVLADSDGKEYVPKEIDAVASTLREALLAIQERRAADLFGWLREVAPLPQDCDLTLPGAVNAKAAVG
ncbi:MAG TPA: branched-chain amino acid aminotransferase [Steroidobacteraceae bacterium]